MKQKVTYPAGVPGFTASDGTKYAANKDRTGTIDAAHAAEAANFGIVPGDAVDEKSDAEIAGEKMDAKLKTLLEGTVGEVTDDLPNLKPEELDRLHSLEKAESGRVTLLSAIDAELASRSK